MTEYKKPADVMEAIGVSGVLSAGLTWHVLGEGLAWAEFNRPADAVKYTMSKKGKGRKYAVMVFEPGKQFSGVIYLTSVKRGLDAGRVITEGQLLDLYHGQEEKPAAEVEEKKPAQKPASQASEKKPVKKAAKKPAKAVKEKVIKETTQKPAPKNTGLQFGPALVADKEGKITIASLLHAGKTFASRTVPTDFEKRFKKYSDDNQLLLYLQGGPDLPAVRTYRGWLKQGRQVTRGQHGLKILAPRMVEKEDGTKAIDGLRLITLFSIDQTEKASQEA